MPDALRPHGPQHTRPPCPSPAPRVYSDPCPLSQWCHSIISSSVVPFSSCPQSFPASGSFPMSQLFAWGGQSIEVSASASVLPMNTQDWSPLGWTGWISLHVYIYIYIYIYTHTYILLWLIHAVCQKPTHCKAIILQIKKKTTKNWTQAKTLLSHGKQRKLLWEEEGNVYSAQMPHLCYLELVCQHEVSDESRFTEAGEMKSTLREWPLLEEDISREDNLFWLLGCMSEKGWERSIVFKHIPCVIPTLSAPLHFNLTFLPSFLSLDFCSPSRSNVSYLMPSWG